MKQEKRHPVEDLDSENIHCLGECVRDLIACLGYGSQADPLEASLFREVVDIAVYQLTLRQGMRRAFREPGDDTALTSFSIPLGDLAQTLIAQTGETKHTLQQLEARVEFALKLDGTCSEAYLLKGDIAERRKSYRGARAAYEQAMQLSLAKLGSDVFEMAARKEVHFWGSFDTRPYMRARAALAYLLWQQFGKTQEAIDHFRAMLELNPNDNQGNRYAIICCLLEQGDDEALEKALQRYFLYTDEYGEGMDLRETCWWYITACLRFRRASHEPGRSTRDAASKALRTAFASNKHVPSFLLRPETLADFGEPDYYGQGDEREAAWFSRLAFKGWQQTPGALDWLQAAARRNRLIL